MKFFAHLFGNGPDPSVDPTLAWPAFALPIPDFDVPSMRFGSLHFGDLLDDASFLGRPDRFAWTSDDYCELLYATGGFQIDFDDGRLAYLAFVIGPDKYLPKHTALAFSQPRLRGGLFEGLRVTPEVNRTALEGVFGAPDSVDADSDETILYYHREGVTMEFELDGKTGGVKRWNLYPI